MARLVSPSQRHYIPDRAEGMDSTTLLELRDGSLLMTDARKDDTYYKFVTRWINPKKKEVEATTTTKTPGYGNDNINSGVGDLEKQKPFPRLNHSSSIVSMHQLDHNILATGWAGGSGIGLWNTTTGLQDGFLDGASPFALVLRPPRSDYLITGSIHSNHIVLWNWKRWHQCISTIDTDSAVTCLCELGKDVDDDASLRVDTMMAR